MSLKAPAIPSSVSSALQSRLGDFVPTGSNVWHLLLHSYKAHPVFNLNLNQVPRGWTQGSPAPPLDQNITVPTGWRFLASNAGQVGGCHVGPESGNATPKLTGFSGEAEIADVVEAIGELEKLPQVQNGSYELRVLRITWLRRELFWLHPDAGDDLVVPYSALQGDARKLRARKWSEYWTKEISPEIDRVTKAKTLFSHCE